MGGSPVGYNLWMIGSEVPRHRFSTRSVSGPYKKRFTLVDISLRDFINSEDVKWASLALPDAVREDGAEKEWIILPVERTIARASWVGGRNLNARPIVFSRLWSLSRSAELIAIDITGEKFHDERPKRTLYEYRAHRLARIIHA